MLHSPDLVSEKCLEVDVTEVPGLWCSIHYQCSVCESAYIYIIGLAWLVIDLSSARNSYQIPHLETLATPVLPSNTL